jgi:ubiquitin C-terminal hydrolase
MLGAVDPSDFKKVINIALPLFFGNHQQDAAEFYNFLMDKMHMEMNRNERKR